MIQSYYLFSNIIKKFIYTSNKYEKVSCEEPLKSLKIIVDLVPIRQNGKIWYIPKN